MKRHTALIPLSREHNTALVLALRIDREAPGADVAGIAAIYDVVISFWARGLLPHFRAENECLLARLIRHVKPDHELIARTQRDHLGIEALVADMRDNPDIAFRRRVLRMPSPRQHQILSCSRRDQPHNPRAIDFIQRNNILNALFFFTAKQAFPLPSGGLSR